MKPESFVRLGKWISILSRHGQMFLARHLKQYGVGPGQLPYIRILYAQDGVSLDTLSKLLVIDKATTTRALIALEESGLVTRVTDAEDRRVKRVFLTEKAWQIKPAIDQTLAVWADVLTSKLTEEETAQVVHLLEKVASGVVEFHATQDKEDHDPDQ